MTLTCLIRGPNPIGRLETWKRRKHTRGHDIETCGFYFPGNQTLIFWYEKSPVSVVVVLDEVRKQSRAPR